MTKETAEPCRDVTWCEGCDGLIQVNFWSDMKNYYIVTCPNCSKEQVIHISDGKADVKLKPSPETPDPVKAFWNPEYI